MGKTKKKKEANSDTITVNRSARHEFNIEDTYQAGLVLDGWEVKSIRAGRINITDSYVFIKQNEIFISGANISPLLSASTHVKPQAMKVRKLLLNRREIDKLSGQVQRQGYTLVPMKLYFVKGRVKLDIGLGKGKKDHDKRQDSKERDWKRDKARLMKSVNR